MHLCIMDIRAHVTSWVMLRVVGWLRLAQAAALPTACGAGLGTQQAQCTLL